MTKVLHKKPGPKSSKQSKILRDRGTLGDTTCESSNDDSSADYTVDDIETIATTPKNRVKTQHVNGHPLEFCTPEAENDATDYGLEFTTSHIRNSSPRRCSTLRTAESASENSKNATEENDTPTSSHIEKPLKKDTQQKATKSNTVAKPKNTTSSGTQVAVASQPVKKPRKQRNPLQLEKRFWKEVQALQNRTDNLIPMLPFSRLIREIIHDSSTHVTKITPTALEAIQTSAELYLTQTLQDAYMLTLHRGRVTLDVKDIQLIKFLKINL